jgi:hypothetical protein
VITLLLVAAALAFVFWPRGEAVAKRLPSVPGAADLFHVSPLPPVVVKSVPSPRAAIDALLAVRDTLDTPERPLDPESGKAIDKLWLDLLHSKDKK